LSEPDLILKRGEAKTAVTLTVTDPANDDAAVNISSATLTFILRPKVGSSVISFQKDHAVFNIAQASVGVVSFPMSAAESNRVGTFYGELKMYFAADDIDKSKTFEIRFDEAIT